MIYHCFLAKIVFGNPSDKKKQSIIIMEYKKELSFDLMSREKHKKNIINSISKQFNVYNRIQYKSIISN
jgi:hypothetical protein